jgi:hypothetical protein
MSASGRRLTYRCKIVQPYVSFIQQHAGLLFRSCGLLWLHLVCSGDRQLNSVLHIMAITQIRRPTEGQAHYQRNAPWVRGARRPCAA